MGIFVVCFFFADCSGSIVFFCFVLFFYWSWLIGWLQLYPVLWHPYLDTPSQQEGERVKAVTDRFLCIMPVYIGVDIVCVCVQWAAFLCYCTVESQMQTSDDNVAVHKEAAVFLW